ncbi:phosphatase PAP2 family protein [Shewanella sp. A25]|nr:phosphatase PAP2 family protein [Shewanella shenzhenensis]
MLAFAVVIFVMEMTQADMRWATTLFHWQGGIDSWPLRGHWLTQSIFHTSGRNLVVLLALLVLLGVGLSFRNPWLRPYRRGLSYLFTSVLASVLLVRIGKDITHMACPWDVVEFGGRMLHYSLFVKLPEGTAYGQCFPGGHSSGGYAWVALFYFFKEYQPRYAKAGLIFGLVLGAVFGFAQELRGAHFLSHDLWSLAIAWTSASLLYYGFFLWHPSANRIKHAQIPTAINTAILNKSMTK